MPSNDCLFCDNVLSNDITSLGVFKQKMKPPVDLRIVTAEKGDEERILKFLQNNFYVEEPTSVCLKRLPKTVEDCKPLKYLPEGHSFIAIDASDESKDNVVGVILNHEVRASDLAEYNRLIKENQNNTYGEIIKILAKLDNEGDVWNRIKVEKAFSTSIVSVKKSYRGLNIGKKLMERSLERARSCNYTHAMVECSSFYSAQFVASLGFELFHEILYKDYLNDNGQVVFPVSKPHEALKKYVKRL